MRTYDCTFFCDPGHGWLRVSGTLLEELGLEDRISPYSYQRGRFVYLEEDRDLPLFSDAMTRIGRPIHIREVYTNGPSKIRRYASYGE